MVGPRLRGPRFRTWSPAYAGTCFVLLNVWLHDWCQQKYARRVPRFHNYHVNLPSIPRYAAGGPAHELADRFVCGRLPISQFNNGPVKRRTMQHDLDKCCNIVPVNIAVLDR